MLNIKVTSLLKELDEEVETVEIMDETTIEVNGSEYKVLTDEEADEEFNNYQESLIDDMGITAFSEFAQEYILNNYVNEEWFDEALREMQENYVSDIKYEEGRLEEEMREAEVETEEDYIEYLIQNSGNSIQYYKDNFGNEEFSIVCKKNDLINWADVIDWTKEVDGRLCLAGYDGVEMELSNELYAYRTN